MIKKIIGLMFFLSLFVFSSLFAQTIDIKILGEEENSRFTFFIFNVNANGIPDRIIARAISTFLQRNYIISGVDLNTLQEINDDEFSKDLGFGEIMGGHPIYEKWYGRNLGWHCLEHNGFLYVMDGMWPDVFYKAKITK